MSLFDERESQAELRERHRRHRRNLIALSLVVGALSFSGGRIEALNILGTRIVFEYPEAPYQLLVASLSYMFIKYLQYVYMRGGLQFSGEFWGRVESRLASVVVQKYEVHSERENRHPEDLVHLIERQPGGRYVFRISEGFTTGLHDLRDSVVLTKWDLLPQMLRAFVEIVFLTTWFGDELLPILCPLVAVLPMIANWSSSVSIVAA